MENYMIENIPNDFNNNKSKKYFYKRKFCELDLNIYSFNNNLFNNKLIFSNKRQKSKREFNKVDNEKDEINSVYKDNNNNNNNNNNDNNFITGYNENRSKNNFLSIQRYMNNISINNYNNNYIDNPALINKNYNKDNTYYSNNTNNIDIITNIHIINMEIEKHNVENYYNEINSKLSELLFN